MFCEACEEGGPKHGVPVNGEESLIAAAEVCDACEKEHPGAFWVSECELFREEPEGFTVPCGNGRWRSQIKLQSQILCFQTLSMDFQLGKAFYIDSEYMT